MKHETVTDISIEDGVVYCCGRSITEDKCISIKDGEECVYGYFDNKTNTIRCCSLDYLKERRK